VFERTLSATWQIYLLNKDYIVPLLPPLTTLIGTIVTLLVGIVVALVALKQARTSTRVADIAARRHEEQTRADRERRITENLTKSVEQLGSDKLQIRLGGIFGLERISLESNADYWLTMELLTAFIRESVRWSDPEGTNPCKEDPGFDLDEAPPSPEYKLTTDIAAALTVIRRRNTRMRVYERGERRVLDLSASDLRGADFAKAHLDGADFTGANLERVNFEDARLEFTLFMGAHLKAAVFDSAQLTAAGFAGANLIAAYFSRANLQLAVFAGARLEGACFWEADLKGALFWSERGTSVKSVDFKRAHLEGVSLAEVTDLTSAQIEEAFGDEKTSLPEGVDRPVHWPVFRPHRREEN